MKKLFYLLMLVSVITSCSVHKGSYDMKLQKVERTKNSENNYGESKIVNFKEEGKSKYSYEDQMIKIVWTPVSTQFGFILDNKTNHSIKIIWDEAVYIDENGSSERVMHSGVKYSESTNPQIPTIIIKNGNVSDILIPVDNIYYVSGKYGGWNTQPLFTDWAYSPEELYIVTQEYIGKSVKILLPLKIEGVVNEYIFTFKFEGFTPD